MKSFNTYKENLEDLRQKALEKAKEKEKQDKEANTDAKIDDMKAKLKQRYDINVD